MVVHILVGSTLNLRYNFVYVILYHTVHFIQSAACDLDIKHRTFCRTSTFKIAFQITIYFGAMRDTSRFFFNIRPENCHLVQQEHRHGYWQSPITCSAQIYIVHFAYRYIDTPTDTIDNNKSKSAH